MIKVFTLIANLFFFFITIAVINGQNVDFTIKVSGKAIYEDGRRDIKDFETSDQIIVIDESKLK